MARVYSLHTIALKAGADGAEFERFFHEVFEPGPKPSGLTMRLLKGDRGDRAGKYLLMFEMESAERRAQLFPEPGPGARHVSDEVMQWMAGGGEALAKWNQFATPFDTLYTDYVEV